ncbi:unnamed protein product [Zymoseptoria tritici ST99CH_3D1]|uniref:Dynamin GTPase n=1 Tax=Zymoseptoria tritici (strain CBS 115943 / IPO323) TaxID=336722 RepID=F9XMY1_ZYMTI|nr:uncharacterized protein MYCGRDRAFT_49293 [Zymoseptoria tritici IPO323]EGP83318.1 hypothetical protein MYCGRDRAFT_49293 [Zymoseptoria tritici IPO323]SMR63523.1 unnamed protein product [Zymoseptoria tritici ST99CH_3D1]
MAPTSTTALADPLMLDKIDKLFACGVGELVDLPQIVVVGDQSSGKSSVLEGLIRKPLPRDSGLCTRFATQIVFRRAKVEGIEVSIIPDKDADPQHVARVKKWGKKVEEELDSEVFVKIMEEVHTEMGLAGFGGDDDGEKRPTFSNDVLRLEISGPEQEHLSVIDVPGIFKSTTEGVTTKADIALVRNMVHGYMNNPRSVILAVVPANVDVATQEILELATEADPQGDRTLGVLTKPDLMDRGTEGRSVDLLEGRARVMQLGWHVIRNPGQMEMAEKNLDRNTLERDFFRNKAPWSDLDDDKVGVDTLRIRLKDVISSLVKREFPKVKAEIKNRLNARQKRLDQLGPERRGTMEQMAYLTKMAAQFQRIASLALSANYGADDVFNDDSSLRIAPAIMARMKTFSDDMAKLGHEYEFMSVQEKDDPSAAIALALATSAAPLTPVKLDTFKIREQEDVEELTEILHAQSDLCCPLTDGMEDWLNRVFRGNRGFELGTFNATILSTAMKKQSQKWADITKGFLSDIIVMVHRFILGALKVVCNDTEIRTAVKNTLAEDLAKCYHKAMENANFLLKVESCDTPTTLNHYFNDNLQKSRHGKVVAGMKRKAFTIQGYGECVKLDTATAPINNMSNEDHVIHDIHDILMSYYKVSRKTFVDSICKQAVSHYLLHCETSPLALFSPIWVSQLSVAALEEIAGEAPAVRRSRALLTKEIGSLRESMKILAWN